MADRTARWNDTRIAIVVAVAMTLVVAVGVYGVGRVSTSVAERQDRVAMIAEANAAAAADAAQEKIDAAARDARDQLIGVASDAVWVRAAADYAAGLLPWAPIASTCGTPQGTPPGATYSAEATKLSLTCNVLTQPPTEGAVAHSYYRALVDVATQTVDLERAPDLDSVLIP